MLLSVIPTRDDVLFLAFTVAMYTIFFTKQFLSNEHLLLLSSYMSILCLFVLISVIFLLGFLIICPGLSAAVT